MVTNLQHEVLAVLAGGLGADIVAGHADYALEAIALVRYRYAEDDEVADAEGALAVAAVQVVDQDAVASYGEGG